MNGDTLVVCLIYPAYRIRLVYFICSAHISLQNIADRPGVKTTHTCVMLRESCAYSLGVLQELISAVLNACFLPVSFGALDSGSNDEGAHFICGQCFTGEILGAGVKASLHHS